LFKSASFDVVEEVELGRSGAKQENRPIERERRGAVREGKRRKERGNDSASHLKSQPHSVAYPSCGERTESCKRPENYGQKTKRNLRNFEIAEVISFETHPLTLTRQLLDRHH